MSDVADHKPWWLQPLAESQAERAADAAGLSSVEARSRLAELGPNRFRDHQEQPLWLQFLARFKNPLVILLLVASAISALTGEITNFLIITAMVLFSVTLDFVQEHRAGQAAESLRHSVSVRAKVIRDGKPLAVPVTEVVPGDLAVLSAGDMVPADGWVLEANDLFVKQALLTGEPYPVEKRPGAPAAVAAIGAVLPFTPLGTYFGFVPPPAQFYFILAGMVVIYLVMVEAAKQGFYRWHGVSGKARNQTD